ncbi:MAG: hypothetical protein CMG74_04090 [Candidatus Marinimicrobia bacterium]|nr:hypothetical protein [Candidatus Neomarinimicrobiota bacterium]|tara:strand:+ start:25430 stop:26641 length:1212 start_codon:yes stop_codon:yes gene_type:complete
MNIYIFEDQDAINLSPISATRPAFEVYCGIFTGLERIKLFFPDAEFSFFVRNEFVDMVKQNYPENNVNPISVNDGVWLLGNVLWEKDDLNYIINNGYQVYVNADKIIGMNLGREKGQKWVDSGGPLKNKFGLISELNNGLSSPVINYLWDAVEYNPRQIMIDSKQYNKGNNLQHTNMVTLIDQDKVFIGENSIINPYTVLDASNGEIIIEENVKINSFCQLEGPLFIGKGSIIRPNTQLKSGTSIGPFSKIGGEISQSIIQGNTNKIHYGYIGNSYIGEWVNIGAGATCSNIKNNYSNITVMIKGELLNTKKNKIGCFIGDYTKIAIGTSLSTGTVIEVGCNISPKNTSLPKYISPFTWFVNDEKTKYDWEKFVKTLKEYYKGKGSSISEVQLFILKKNFDNR